MKTSCKIIEDLLPMYHDGICSEESSDLIEEHLRECPNCSQILASLRGEIQLEKDIPAVWEMLYQGSQEAKAQAAENVDEVKTAMKIDYFN